VESIVLHPDANTATIRFETPDSAKTAVRASRSSLHSHLRKSLILNDDVMLRATPARADSDLERTVFVGNLDKSMSRKQLQKAFSECGKVETVRFRGITPDKMGLPKKAAAILHKTHDKRDNITAYVVFSSAEGANNAVRTMNGVQLEEKTLRVDHAAKSSGNESSHLSIFLGNLPFDVTEEEIRKVFAPCCSKTSTKLRRTTDSPKNRSLAASQNGSSSNPEASIVNVRVIRDEASGMGKGFGYVSFSSAESVKRALLLHEVVRIGSRLVRVEKCVAGEQKESATKEHTSRKQTTARRASSSSDSARNRRHAPGARASASAMAAHSFEGERAVRGDRKSARSAGARLSKPAHALRKKRERMNVRTGATTRKQRSSQKLNKVRRSIHKKLKKQAGS